MSAEVEATDRLRWHSDPRVSALFSERDKARAKAARLAEVLDDLLSHADNHHLSHADCSLCSGGRCYEEWCIVRDDARLMLADEREVSR